MGNVRLAMGADYQGPPKVAYAPAGYSLGILTGRPVPLGPGTCMLPYFIVGLAAELQPTDIAAAASMPPLTGARRPAYSNGTTLEPDALRDAVHAPYTGRSTKTAADNAGSAGKAKSKTSRHAAAVSSTASDSSYSGDEAQVGVLAIPPAPHRGGGETGAGFALPLPYILLGPDDEDAEAANLPEMARSFATASMRDSEIGVDTPEPSDGGRHSSANESVCSPPVAPAARADEPRTIGRKLLRSGAPTVTASAELGASLSRPPSFSSSAAAAMAAFTATAASGAVKSDGGAILPIPSSLPLYTGFVPDNVHKRSRLDAPEGEVTTATALRPRLDFRLDNGAPVSSAVSAPSSGRRSSLDPSSTAPVIVESSASVAVRGVGGAVGFDPSSLSRPPGDGRADQRELRSYSSALGDSAGRLTAFRDGTAYRASSSPAPPDDGIDQSMGQSMGQLSFGDGGSSAKLGASSTGGPHLFSAALVRWQLGQRGAAAPTPRGSTGVDSTFGRGGVLDDLLLD
jgi:hypothetical protein